MWAHLSGTMAKLISTLALFVLLAVGISAVPGKRTRRGFNNSGFSGGYGRGSDERDASTSQEGGNGCSNENSRNYSGSRELAYNRDGRQSNENNRGSRSFAKASASAAATSFNENRSAKNLIV